MVTQDKEYELGPQPLDALLEKLQLSNTNVVEALPAQQLSHKMVQKGRNGRRISINIQNKILKALNGLHPDQKFKLNDLFNY